MAARAMRCRPTGAQVAHAPVHETNLSIRFGNQIRDGAAPEESAYFWVA